MTANIAAIQNPVVLKLVNKLSTNNIIITLITHHTNHNDSILSGNVMSFSITHKVALRTQSTRAKRIAQPSQLTTTQGTIYAAMITDIL